MRLVRVVPTSLFIGRIHVTPQVLAIGDDPDGAPWLSPPMLHQPLSGSGARGPRDGLAGGQPRTHGLEMLEGLIEPQRESLEVVFALAHQLEVVGKDPWVNPMPLHLLNPSSEQQGGYHH